MLLQILLKENPKFELDTDSLKISKLIALKKVNPNLKVLYSVGGWVWSNEFSHTAAYHRVTESNLLLALLNL